VSDLNRSHLRNFADELPELPINGQAQNIIAKPAIRGQGIFARARVRRAAISGLLPDHLMHPKVITPKKQPDIAYRPV